MNIFPDGISGAVSALVGMSLGSSDIWSAKKYAWLAIVLGLAQAGVLCTLIYVFRPWIANIYTD